jgi:hypothetical protein
MFSNLKRLYLPPDNIMAYPSFPAKEFRNIILGCPSLESITQVSHRPYQYQRTKVQRGEDGAVVLSEHLGCGRVIGWEDSDFPGLL